jgi:hypothetical protein
MIDSPFTQYELRFNSLFDSGRGYAFPCDPDGHVDINQLSDRARNNYLFARAVVGLELAVPAVRPNGTALMRTAASIQSKGRVSNAMPSFVRATG